MFPFDNVIMKIFTWAMVTVQFVPSLPVEGDEGWCMMFGTLDMRWPANAMVVPDADGNK